MRGLEDNTTDHFGLQKKSKKKKKRKKEIENRKRKGKKEKEKEEEKEMERSEREVGSLGVKFVNPLVPRAHKIKIRNSTAKWPLLA